MRNFINAKDCRKTQSAKGRLMMRYLQQFSAATAMALVLAGGSAHAQDSSQTDEEADDGRIIVTASKVGAQDIQETPLAIQVFDGDAMRERNITNIGDLVSAVPGAQEGGFETRE